ncbi:MAG: hypothetical protein PF569_02585 [Candidatus Woesearchaeota archaeon]|jgi:uncharacterized protein YacL|nr:hypothetical protein [Candidatus Woesearchaeota archaeon]
MVNEPKFYKVRDIAVLSAIPIISGLLVVFVQFLINTFSDLTLNLLPKSLEAYIWSQDFLDIPALGFMGMVCALIVAYFSKDRNAFDNIKQMLVGMIIGLIVTVVFAILELFSMGEYVFVALVLEVAIVSIYSLVRWFD